MLLAIDVGNTNITCAVFDNNKIIEMTGFSACKNETSKGLEKYLRTNIKEKSIKHCIISSVVDELTDKLVQATELVFNVKPMILNTDLKLGITIKSEHPELCGTDRIANACAASALYKHRPIVVVDSGTAITFDIIDKYNNFLCGVIMPGLDMQLGAMGSNTSKLPSLTVHSLTNKELSIISDNTEDAMLSGVVLANAQAIQGLLMLCAEELGEKPYVVGTGGNAKITDKYFSELKFDTINPFLTLQGIRMIYELNSD